jgi:uncharacterized 2Fe-2S/4Fe-4S cluster protein (DUF4445 family)
VGTFIVDLEPIGRRMEVPSGTSLLIAAQKAGVDLVAVCGGIGICGTCLVRLVSGTLSAVTESEEEMLTREQLAQGFRLACQAEPTSNVRLDIPPESLPAAQKMMVEGHETETDLKPSVVVMDVEIRHPDLQDLRSDLTRVNDFLIQSGKTTGKGDLTVLTKISDQLRAQNWSGRLVTRDLGNHTGLISILKPGTHPIGLAVDMGSTKLAVYLVDLESGVTIASTGIMNPQIAYGEDVISRIAFANRENGNRKLLQTRLVETLNQTVTTLLGNSGADRDQLVDGVMVGNTAMHHFLCNLPVTQLGAAPYVAAVSEPLDIRASEVGIEMAPGANIHIPANIAGYVGADHTSALLASQSFAVNETMVLVDIGTNTEISITHKGRVLSCSTASGPAFEGAHIRDGMRAAPGAIEKVLIKDQKIEIFTIAGAAPVGLCGTGILKAISEMADAGILDNRGVFTKRATGYEEYIQQQRGPNGNSVAQFLLVPAHATGHGRDILVTRKDIHEIQLAKGAIRTGIEVLLKETGLSPLDVDHWVIAGAFGTYLDLNSALRIGMFPSAPIERFHQVGNAAGVGAKQMLLSKHRRETARELASKVEYIELTVYPDFTNMYVDSMYFTVE